MNEQLQEMIEPVARQLAADKCGLTKFVDGSNLPDDLWMQCTPDAIQFLGLDVNVQQLAIRKALGNKGKL